MPWNPLAERCPPARPGRTRSALFGGRAKRRQLRVAAWLAGAIACGAVPRVASAETTGASVVKPTHARARATKTQTTPPASTKIGKTTPAPSDRRAPEPPPPSAQKNGPASKLAGTKSTRPPSATKHKPASEVVNVSSKSSQRETPDANGKLGAATTGKSRPGSAVLAKSSGTALARKSRENAYLEFPDRAFVESTRAYRYANLSNDEAFAELDRRGIAWTPATPPFSGVRAPIRLAGPLHDVVIHSSLPPAERVTSPFEILDARLALALDDFCALLARHDIVEIVHYTMYRPPAAAAGDMRQIRHPAGLAIDVGAFRKRDGRVLSVGPHWPSNIGAKTCGDGAVEQSSREARELVSIVCEAADERFFHFELTPDCDAAHADHIHLEIKPAARWFIIN